MTLYWMPGRNARSGDRGVTVMTFLAVLIVVGLFVALAKGLMFNDHSWE